MEAWSRHLNNYWDKQLIDLTQYGFPLDFDRNCTLGETLDNHTSANSYASHVTKYIQDELHFGGMGLITYSHYWVHFCTSVSVLDLLGCV